MATSTLKQSEHITTQTISGTTGATHGELVSNIPITSQVLGITYNSTNVLVIPYAVNNYWGFAFRRMTDFGKITNTSVTIDVMLYD